MRNVLFALLLTLFSILPLISFSEEVAAPEVDSLCAAHRGALLTSHVDGARRFSLHALEDGAFAVQVDSKKNGQWKPEVVNPSVMPWNDTAPSLSTDGQNRLFIRFADLAYAVLEPDAFGDWRITLWDVHPEVDCDELFTLYPNAVSIYRHDAAQSQPLWIYGTLCISRDLESLDTSSLPSGFADLKNLINPAGWAVISSNNEAGMQAVYGTPNPSRDQICTLYDGAPVRLLGTEPGWFRIEVAGRIGWVPQASLVTGFDMLMVSRHFPDLSILPESLTEDAAIYALPTVDSPVLQPLKPMGLDALSRFSVIGSVSDAWYVVFSPEGISGFIEGKWLSAGCG